MAKLLLCAALASLLAGPAAAVETIPLWPDGAPSRSTITEPEAVEARGDILNVTEGRMDVYLAANANGRAVIVMPGGGYGKLSMKSMTGSFVPFLNEKGFTVFLLKYRLPKGNPEVPHADANRAASLVRSAAGKYGIRSVGVIGASAGGHLAAIASTRCSDASCPDFSILIYPNITMMHEETLLKSSCRKNLLGEERSVKYDAAYSAYKQAGLETPPAFIAVSAQDQFAGSLVSLLCTRAMVENNRPVTLHVYPTGDHGWAPGKAGKSPDGDRFHDDLSDWLETLP